MKVLIVFLALVLLPSRSSAEPMKPAAVAVNQLGADLYQRLKGDKKENICLSPYSVATALAMTAGAAQGETRREMLATLHLAGREPELIGDLRTPLRQAAGEMEYRGANAIFLQTGFSLGTVFSRKLEQRFGARAFVVDFRNAPGRAKGTINRWVENQTNRRIENLISEAPAPTTVAVLVNAIYLKAKWETPFDPNNTSHQPFRTFGAGKVSVPMMENQLTIPVKDQLDCTIFALPYKGGKYDFVVILPHRSSSLRGVAGRLGGKLSRPVAQLPREEVLVRMPKFNVEGDALELKKPLQELGMRRAFTDDAEFGESAGALVPGLRIDNVIHKTFIEVDEAGTEAAAATAVLMDYKGIAPKPPREIRVDRPFFFAIQHRETGTCLFVGAVSDPSKR